MSAGGTGGNDPEGGTYPPVGAPGFDPNDPYFQGYYDREDPNATYYRPLSEDLSAAIEYHVIEREISDLSAFSVLHGEEDGKALSAQQRARDFLVLRDTVPLMVYDDEEEDDDDLTSFGYGSNNSYNSDRDKGATRPYLDADTPAYRVAQRYSIAAFFYATNTEGWEDSDRWLDPGVHECEFLGVTCEDVEVPAVSLKEVLEGIDVNGTKYEVDEPMDWESSQGPNLAQGASLGAMPQFTRNAGTVVERMIVAIDLPENGLSGYLPRELMGLPFLRRLGLWSNDVSGSIPPQIGQLSRLEVLLLDDNDLGGNIPREIGRLGQLTDLSLDLNRGITGRIPPEIGNLRNLERLRLSNMNLQGPVPRTVGRLSNLQDLQLQNNRLAQALPEEMGKLKLLEALDLSGNNFAGGIPVSWVGGLLRLKRLKMQGNGLEFNLDEMGLCELMEDWVPPAGGGVGGGERLGLLEALEADCDGPNPKVICSCCTACLP
jgi:hypothetical protein